MPADPAELVDKAIEDAEIDEDRGVSLPTFWGSLLDVKPGA